jgi:hypothetical protein
LFNRASIKDLMAMKIATYLPCEEVLTAGFEAKPRRPAHPIDCSGCRLRIRGAKINYKKLEVEHQIPARKGFEAIRPLSGLEE